MSNDPNIKVTDHEQNASDAIALIDAAPKKVTAFIEKLEREIPLSYVSCKDLMETCAAIEQLVDDMFFKSRQDLVKIAGEPLSAPEIRTPAPNQAMKDFSVQSELRKL